MNANYPLLTDIAVIRPSYDKYELTEDLKYLDVVVPKGYTTDGITYKLRFVALFVNKFDPRYITAAIVHDYLTDKGDWDLANKYFEELLPGDFRSKVMVASVKVYRRIIGK